jgi:DNA-directed DNA polymerase III PolC
MIPFVPLRVRSHGSLLHGTASPEALVERALALGYDALALTDRDNLYLAVRFLQCARAEGLRALPGAELTHPSGTALLLPLDRRGWAHLCEVITARQLDPAFDLTTALATRHAGLHVIVESAGLAASLLQAGVPAAAVDTPGRAAVHAGGVWMGVRGLPSERTRLAARVAGARVLGVPLVATGDVTLLDARDHEAHRVAVTAAAGELLERMPPSAFAAREAWLASPAEWVRRVRAVCAAAGVPEAAAPALAHNAALAARCRLELELGTPIFPRAPLADGESGPQRLRRLGREGVRRRWGRDDARALARLEHELGIIERCGFTDYFLLVAEIVGFARDHAIPTVGRGSGASSLVAYALGITNVDPLRHGLYFERFLNPTRRDCPDLDIDLCWKRRDEVIAHVYRTYGEDRVAMISTHTTLGPRTAFREAAKALGVPNARVDALARRVPRALRAPYLDRLLADPGAGGIDWREPVLARALALAERLDGAPRHLSIHCGGLVIADRALTHYVPLERGDKKVVVTQPEMRAIEALGLVKMDLLGNRALSEIGDCVRLVRERHGITLDVDQLPEDDPATAARLAAGDTLNCFQLESPAMRHLLRMLRARTVDEVIAAVALVRPGAAGAPSDGGPSMKEVYCRRHRGLEPVPALHPRLEPVLGPAHGVMLYEEDVMCVGAALAGLTLAEGDDLRRAIAKARDDEEFRSLERGFVGHCVRDGVDEPTARAAWRDLTRFAAYAFCKAHAAGYGVLGHRSTWLKTHHPAEWAVGVLDHHAGMYATWVHVEDLRRRGVTFRAPCVGASAWDTSLDADGAVRVGLSRVMGLSHATGERLLAARPFADLADLVDRARPSLDELETLVLAGALDLTGRTRPSLLLEGRVAAARGAGRTTLAAPSLAGPGGAPLAPASAPRGLPDLPEFDPRERVRGELRATGLWFSAHPLDVLVPPAALAGTVPAAALESHIGRRVSVAGLPCATRRVETRAGGSMLFLTLADRGGLVECVLFPAAYRAFGAAARGEVVRVEGRVEDALGALTVSVERAWALGAEGGAPAAPRDDAPSRNAARQGAA